MLGARIASGAFAPGSHRLAVVIRPAGRSEVQVVDVDHPGTRRLLFAGPGAFGDVAWSPTGELAARRLADRRPVGVPPRHAARARSRTSARSSRAPTHLDGAVVLRSVDLGACSQVGDTRPRGTVFLGPGQPIDAAELLEDGPKLLVFYLFDWSST